MGKRENNMQGQTQENRGGNRGFGEGRGRGGPRGRGGDRGGARGGRPGGRGGPRRGQEEEWKPTTKLGRLVKNGKVSSFEEIFRFAIPIKEPQIVDHLVKKNSNTLKDEVMKVKPVQKQTKAGQIGLGQKAHKEVQGAIKGATLDAKMNFYPVRKGYWGNKIGQPHTVPFKVTGKCGSVRCRLVPAPRGSSLVAAPTSKKVLQFAGIQDCYTQSRGSTRTKGNFLYAVFRALLVSYTFLSPEFWGKPSFDRTPYETYADDALPKKA